MVSRRPPSPELAPGSIGLIGRPKLELVDPVEELHRVFLPERIMRAGIMM